MLVSIGFRIVFLPGEGRRRESGGGQPTAQVLSLSPSTSFPSQASYLSISLGSPRLLYWLLCPVWLIALKMWCCHGIFWLSFAMAFLFLKDKTHWLDWLSMSLRIEPQSILCSLISCCSKTRLARHGQNGPLLALQTLTTLPVAMPFAQVDATSTAGTFKAWCHQNPLFMMLSLTDSISGAFLHVTGII